MPTPPAIDITDLPVERVPLAALRPDPKNARRHGQQNLDAIRKSLEAFGQRRPLVTDKTGRTVIAGNGTLEVMGELGWETAWITRFPGTAAQARAFAVADNRTAELAEWDFSILTDTLGGFNDDLLAAAGFNHDQLADLLTDHTTAGAAGGGAPVSLTDPDDLPATQKRVTSQVGDMWLLGPHRLFCGDSTNPADVQALCGGTSPVMLHADPPYGMGKEAQGVLNDNLYGDNLDAFQMGWWKAWSPALTDNGTVYIWGNAPDLWRLWWRGGLSDDGDLMVRNEIVWDKGSGIGMRSAAEHSIPTATERCLLLMRGTQFLGNQNKDDYWEGYEPLRAWLNTETGRLGWTAKDLNALTSTQMAGHWLSKSQFSPIPQRHYETLQEAAGGKAFTLSYDELFGQLFPDIKGGGNQHRRNISAKLREVRTHFDNTHDAMTDVWRYPRVTGEERYGHATPKPVAMVERAVLTSSREGDVIAAPFSGTGPEFIAAHRTGRVCVGMELSREYADLICRRWQQHTGIVPVLEATGAEHDFL